MQSGKSFEVSGKWFRYSRYEMLNGVVVRAEASELTQYDPWENFRKNEGKYRTVVQPYTALLNLHSSLKQAEGRGIRPSPVVIRPSDDPLIGPQNDADSLILDWCNRHGLLGLVPVLSNSIFFPRKAGKDDGWNHASHHVRRGGTWGSTSLNWDPNNAGGPHYPATSHVTWLNTWFRTYRECPLEEIRDFFTPLRGPNLDQFTPPCPLSYFFWRCYVEPGASIAYWCSTFALAAEAMSNGRGAERTSAESHRAQAEHEKLSELAGTVAPAFALNTERNTVDEVRVSPGLLASYALMFLWDRMENRRVLRCQNCDAHFISDEARAGYCSQRCRNTAQSRRYRARKAGPQQRRLSGSDAGT